jgi:hypothetical protein
MVTYLTSHKKRASKSKNNLKKALFEDHPLASEELELQDKTQSEKKVHNSLCSLTNYCSLKEEATISDRDKPCPPLLYFESSSCSKKRR